MFSATQQPTNYDALIQKMNEMGIILSPDAFATSCTKKSREADIESTFLRDFLIFGFDTRDYLYINAIVNNSKPPIYIVSEFTEGENDNDIAEYHFETSFNNAFICAITFSESHIGSPDYIKQDGNTLSFYVDGNLSSKMQKVVEGDYSKVDPALVKRAEKALKGLSTGLSNLTINSKLKGFSGLKKANIDLSYKKPNKDKFEAKTISTHHIDDNQWEKTYHTSEYSSMCTNNLYMPTINNFVIQLKTILNHFAKTPVTLSQAQELLLAYFNINNWHHLIRNEKENSYCPYIISMSNENENVIEQKIVKTYAQALVVFDDMIKKSSEQHTVSNWLVSSISAYSENYSVDLQSDYFNNYWCCENEFNEVIASKIFPKLTQIKAAFEAI